MGATGAANLLQGEWFHFADGRMRRVEEEELFHPGGQPIPYTEMPGAVRLWGRRESERAGWRRAFGNWRVSA